MEDILTRPFDPSGFPPRKNCGTGWTPQLIWLHTTSDLFIWLAYVSIPLILLYFTRRRDLPFPRLFLLFALFILACGTTHLIDALLFEVPLYRLAGLMKLATAVVSWVTVVALIPVVPRVMTAVNQAASPGADTRFHAPLRDGKRRRWPDYLAGAIAGGLAVALRGAIDPLLDHGDNIFVLALLAVVYVSWQHGFGPGLTALCVSGVGYNYLFVLPRGQFFVEGLGNQLVVALFFFCGVACTALGESQRTAQRRARRALDTAVMRGDELEAEIARRRLVEQSLRQREQELLQSEEQFRNLTEAIPQIVWTADASGAVRFVNRRWEDYTGMPSDTLAARGWDRVQIHPDDVERLKSNWQLVVAKATDEFSEECRIRRASDGEYRWMLAVATPMGDSSGQYGAWVGALTDIDDQKRHAETLERLVRERTRELQSAVAALTGEIAERKGVEVQLRAVADELKRSNGELETFAYIASHDLQEPLRKIQAFGDRLRERCRDQLPEPGKEYIDRMLVAAGRMRRLIDDLLTFSRVTTQQRPSQRIDLGKLLREVVSDLDTRIAQTDGTVRIGSVPNLEADPTQMRQLLQNLIGNALKFHRPDVPPVVEIAGAIELRSDSDEPLEVCRLTVRDNGIGFDEKYSDRIFEVFQRLHGRDEYEGTGVGLAICRKIVERHGGSITASSRVGEGTTFTVVIPIRPPNAHAAS